MKAPLNTDNWSGSIKSDKAPLNTDDWNGFISADMSRKLSQNCQCIKAPCNCGAIKKVPITYDKPRTESTVRLILMSLGRISDKKLGYIEKRLKGLNGSDLNNLYAIILKEENELQRLNLVYQAIAKADNDRLIKEKENRIEQELSEGFQRRIMPKLRKLESMAREGKADMQSYMNFLEVYKAKLRDGEITLEQYEKQFELKVNELLGIKDPSKKNDKLLIYGLIAVAGYFAYKKFKK